MADTATDSLTELPLAGLHTELGAKFVPFAGWNMPVQYSAGVMTEHLWTRDKAGLFDVSHMAQVRLPKGALEGLEGLVPADLLGLPEGRQRYGVFTNAAGGVLDDLMIAHRAADVFLVVNASRRAHGLAHLRAHLHGVEEVTDRALLALQGPLAEAALAALVPDVAAMRFMDVAVVDWQGADLWISRSGYTGEDGFEISVPAAQAEGFARALLADERVAPVGLGARDSLRLEAGLPLYGQEMDVGISPVEAGQAWSIGKARRAGGARAGGFPGADVILDQIAHGAPNRRVGLSPEGRAPMRGEVTLYATPEGGDAVGRITSGGFGPTLGAPIAIGLITADTPADATLYGDVRGKRLPARQVPLPFVPPGYKR
ncbi:glycine cleavage system aminomethyltransferase GcvT [Roseicyclus mahoneyensis]|uniref:aminomethyltransferase n=1 Tax=Roseicyclus mahoneyensis TaxID=164332 RepID=A0A316GF11_9RHOB|nr:glycine cleavage system aminomethyltransferase GcvT [Roseicyclus mahoneyensis]PWK59272.1 aminomethyltransferase [Roseicyclus mahoneyensis]